MNWQRNLVTKAHIISCVKSEKNQRRVDFYPILLSSFTAMTDYCVQRWSWEQWPQRSRQRKLELHKYMNFTVWPEKCNFSIQNERQTGQDRDSWVWKHSSRFYQLTKDSIPTLCLWVWLAAAPASSFSRSASNAKTHLEEAWTGDIASSQKPKIWWFRYLKEVLCIVICADRLTCLKPERRAETENTRNQDFFS